MVNSISNMSTSTTVMQSRGMQRPPPPKGEDVFQVGDSDGDGVISSSELEALAKGIEEVTGNVIDVEGAIGSFDANADGGLSGEELLEMLTSNGFAPPNMMMNEEGESTTLSPPPPSADQALAAYGQNNGDDQIAQLLALLQNSDSDEDYTSVDYSA